MERKASAKPYRAHNAVIARFDSSPLQWQDEKSARPGTLERENPDRTPDLLRGRLDEMAEEMKCSQCEKVMTRIGEHWYCPTHLTPINADGSTFDPHQWEQPTQADGDLRLVPEAE